MCRLFGLHAGRNVITATFWLLDAPDSLIAQSHQNPDGTGLGVFDADGHPEVRKQPMAAWHDREFACEAHELTGTTFLAHVRYATTGALDVADTHPFLQDGRLFAHNGVVEGLDRLDSRLQQLDASELVVGNTDSERVFALITASIRGRRGDVAAGLVEAVQWIGANVPVYALNMLLSTGTDMWAMRYPETHPLYVLDRRVPTGDFRLRTRRIHARSRHLDELPSVIFASERMDDDPAWRLLDPGELVHVDADLNVASRIAFPAPPSNQLTLADLRPEAAAAQHDLPITADRGGGTRSLPAQ